MDYIKVFLGYSSKQKRLGGKFKSCLVNYCGYEAFIAHEDIPAASIWEDEIIKAINNADFVIPLISEEFKISDFTDQEIGIAVSLNKKIIPVKLDEINPYGFIQKYQALQYKTYTSNPYSSDNMRELILTIAQIGLSYEPDSIYYQKALNSIVHAFCTSHSFDTANATIEIMSKCDKLTSQHLNQIIYAIENNDQVKGAFGLSKLKEFLRSTYRISID